MDKEELDKLIIELESLQIQQEAIIKKIRASTGKEDQSAPTASTGKKGRSAPSEDTQGSVRVGQRVLIKNRLGRTISLKGRTSIKDRVGTITKVTTKRVQITTSTGIETSRAPHNVSPLSQKEYEDIVNTP